MFYNERSNLKLLRSIGFTLPVNRAGWLVPGKERSRWERVIIFNLKPRPVALKINHTDPSKNFNIDRRNGYSWNICNRVNRRGILWEYAQSHLYKKEEGKRLQQKLLS